jgi:menaquinone-9 beta-reductase
MQDRILRSVGADWSAQRAHLSRQSSLIGDLLAGARPLSARPAATAAIPYGFLRAEPIAPEVFPVGDQLAVVPSFTGDGMAIALYSGLEAAQALLAGRSGAAYQHDLIARLRPQFRLAGGIGRLLETPATCGIGVAAARLLPQLVRGTIAATRLRGFADVAASLGAQRSTTTK